MKNVKNPKVNNLQATRELDELVEYGRKLQSDAVFMGVLKIFNLFRHDKGKTVQFEEKQGDLKYSH